VENSNFLAVASYMAYKVMVDWIKVLKVCVSKRHSLQYRAHDNQSIIGTLSASWFAPRITRTGRFFDLPV
jgi:hypothetical protein